ncbi:putative deacetylase sulfotransferase [Cytobacillus firmus]|uniref:Putative deacetylase sulfotransferase n=2 Tax=Cytobacillus firmus TaxID=1399 RepID=A0A800MRU2_CYTFI|nr:putative deacetylase sulfotransferase [Cytobacillus firmus]
MISAKHKEIHFFDYNYNKGSNWYINQFPLLPSNKDIITGEATPYYLFHPLVPERTFNLLPNVKIIVLLRNPIDRAYSHYQMEYKRGIENLSFENAVKVEKKRLSNEIEKMLQNKFYKSKNHQFFSYLSRGIYVDQLKTWMSIFSKEQFLIIKSEDFYLNPSAILKNVITFLELPSREFNEYKEFKIHNEGHYSEMDSIIREKLIAFFQPHNQRLFEFLKRDFGWAH